MLQGQFSAKSKLQHSPGHGVRENTLGIRGPLQALNKQTGWARYRHHSRPLPPSPSTACQTSSPWELMHQGLWGCCKAQSPQERSTEPDECVSSGMWARKRSSGPPPATNRNKKWNSGQ